MPCPLTSNGQPACNIVEHPDRPSESFCATWGKRFYESSPIQRFWWSIVVIALFLLIWRGLEDADQESLAPPVDSQVFMVLVYCPSLLQEVLV
jgi:hypothetical protein